MTAKEKLLKLVGRLSEAGAAAESKSSSRRGSGLVALMGSAPIDDEPFTEWDEAALSGSYGDLAAGGQTVSVDGFRRNP